MSLLPGVARAYRCAVAAASLVGLAVTLLPAGAASATTARRPPACSPIHLSPFEYQQTKGDQTFVTVNFVNDFKTVCVLRGYPSLVMLDATGAVALHPQAAARSLEQWVTLPPNGSAGFVAWFSDQPSPSDPTGSTCAKVSQMRVTISPGPRETLTSPFLVDFSLCGSGVVHVTPLQRGVPRV